jgi:hypothetical protein
VQIVLDIPQHSGPDCQGRELRAVRFDPREHRSDGRLATTKMTWLYSQFQDFAFGLALVCGVMVAVGLVRWAVEDPRGFAHKLFGQLAWASALLAILWAVVVGEHRGWW